MSHDQDCDRDVHMAAADRCIFFSAILKVFYTLYHLFSTRCQFFSTPPPKFSLPTLFFRAWSAFFTVTYTLLGCINVHYNRPMPAHPPTYPAQPYPARHSTPSPGPTRMIAGAHLRACRPSGAVQYTNRLYFGPKLFVHPLRRRVEKE